MIINGKQTYAPSVGPDPWIGTPLSDLETVEQRDTVARIAGRLKSNQRGYELPDFYTVVFQGRDWQGYPRPELTRRYRCPVVSCTKDRKRLHVVSPSGRLVWVDWK